MEIFDFAAFLAEEEDYYRDTLALDDVLAYIHEDPSYDDEGLSPEFSDIDAE